MQNKISGEEQIACVKREIALRRAAYPRWVSSGKLTQAKADREIAVMESILESLEHLELTEQTMRALNISPEDIAAAALRLWKHRIGE